MIKQITVTFDFNSETEEVSNVKVVNSSEKKKSTTTKKAKDIVTETASDAIITLEANKLVFNSKAVADMGIEYEDRIIIKWEKDGKKMIPIVGTDLAFDEEGNGNKVTKTNSIAYKGKANAVLAELGSEFTIEPHREGIWKLVATAEGVVNSDNVTLEEVIEQAEDIDPELIVEGDDETEIDELQFKL